MNPDETRPASAPGVADARPPGDALAAQPITGAGDPPAIDSRAGFAAAVVWGVKAAVGRGARRMVLADHDFAVWPLDTPDLLAQWSSWLRLPGRRLVLLAENYDGLPRRCPRFVEWRRAWSHAVEAWSPEEKPADVPSVLVDDGPICVHLADVVHLRGTAVRDAREARRWRDRIDAVLQRSEPAFPVKPLGL